MVYLCVWIFVDDSQLLEQTPLYKAVSLCVEVMLKGVGQMVKRHPESAFSPLNCLL